MISGLNELLERNDQEALQYTRIMFLIFSPLTLCITGWDSCEAGSVGASQLQGPGFDTELRLLSVWHFAYSPDVHVWVSTGISDFFTQSKNMLVCTLAMLGCS